MNAELTTPVLCDDDAVFPGENWFYYWKTSASLWKAKLEQLPMGAILYVPLNWAFHSHHGEGFDFGGERPETQLAKLVQLAAESSVKLEFLLPLAPAPFLPNGGLPPYLARVAATDFEGINQGCFDAFDEHQLLFSFFDSRVFKGFAQFVHALRSYFDREKLSVGIRGIDCGTVTGEQWHSFFQDYSHVYEQAFTRFLAAKRELWREEGVTIDNPGHEKLLHEEFFHTIRQLYSQEAKRILGDFWEGENTLNFLGGSRSDFFKRLSGQESASDYIERSLTGITLGVIPSTVLLPTRNKTGILNRFLQELSPKSLYSHFGANNDFIENNSYTPLVLFELYGSTPGRYESLGLLDFIHKRHTYCLQKDKLEDFIHQEDRESDERFYIFEGADLDQKKFSHILRLFLNGANIILDKGSLNVELRARFETFILENELELDHYHFGPEVSWAHLGEGNLVVLDFRDVAELSPNAKNNCWQRVFSLNDFKALDVELPDGVFQFWRRRFPTPGELKFHEVRRLGIFNPHSYKHKFKIPMNRSFVLTKIIDQVQAEAKTVNEMIELEMGPHGSLIFEFGVLE